MTVLTGVRAHTGERRRPPPCGLIAYQWHPNGADVRGHCRCGWVTRWKRGLTEVWRAYSVHRGARLLVRSDVGHGAEVCVSYREERGE